MTKRCTDSIVDQHTADHYATNTHQNHAPIASKLHGERMLEMGSVASLSLTEAGSTKLNHFQLNKSAKALPS